MISVTLPDGSVRQFPDGTTEADVLAAVGGGTLAPKVPAVPRPAADVPESGFGNIPAQAPDPTSQLREASGIGPVLDTINRLRRSGTELMGQALTGVSRLGYGVGSALGIENTPKAEWDARLRELSPTFRLGEALIGAAPEAFPVDPARDESFVGKVAGGLGTTIPVAAATIAGGPLAGAAVYGLSSGEQGAQEAIAAGRPEQQMKAFAAYAPIGALSELALGVAPAISRGVLPSLLRRRATRAVEPLADTVTGGVARGFAREASQEGLEQFGQNVAAQQIFDPNRQLSEGVLESALVGGVVGGGVGGAATAVAKLADPDLRKSYEREVEKAGFDLNNVAFETGRKVVVNEPAIAELRSVQSRLADPALPEAERGTLQARLPELEQAAGRTFAAEAYVDTGTGKLTIHLPDIRNLEHLRNVLVEERTHLLTASPEGVAKVQEFVKSHPLAPEQVRALAEQGYIQRADETDEAYKLKLADEFLGKLEREPWWKRWTQEGVAWAKKAFGLELTPVQAGRVLLRSLKFAAAGRPAAGVAGGRRESLGYHAGDLGYGLDTAAGRMSGGRSTGHFGTGVYFVGSSEKITGREGRPVRAVDLSQFRLFRPKTASEAEELHSALRDVNRVVDRLNDLRVSLRSLPDADTDQEFLDAQRRKLQEKITALSQSSSAKLASVVGAPVSASDILRVAEETESQTAAAPASSQYVESASTRAMRRLGFEGIDVRHLPEFDNTAYGTVVYRDTLSSPDIRYSLAASSTDREYLDAVAKGDMAKAQKMVDEAARAAGYTVGPVFHGTPSGGFTVFDTYGSNYGLMGMGAYFTESRTVAETYTRKRTRAQASPTVYRAFLRTGKSIDMDGPADPAWSGVLRDAGIETDPKTNEEAFRELELSLIQKGVPAWEGAEAMQSSLIGMGFGSITHIGGGRVDPSGERHRVWIVFDPGQIKSADPVTRDAQGNVIPLSQRFQQASPDIRYSLTPAPTPQEQYPTAPIQIVTEGPDVEVRDGVVRIREGVPGDSPKVAEAVTRVGIDILPDQYLGRIAYWLQTYNPALVARESTRLGLAPTDPALVRHLLALELEDWRLRDAIGGGLTASLVRLAQAARIRMLPGEEREAAQALRRTLRALPEQFASGEKVTFDPQDQEAVFANQNKVILRSIGPWIQSLRRIVESGDAERYDRTERFAKPLARLERLASEARIRMLGRPDPLDVTFSPTSKKFLEQIQDAGVTPSEVDVQAYATYQEELEARRLASALDKLEAARARAAYLTENLPKFDQRELTRAINRLGKTVAAASPERMARAEQIRADRNLEPDRRAAALALADPQMQEFAEVLDRVGDRPVADAPTESDNVLAMVIDDMAERTADDLSTFLNGRYGQKLAALRSKLLALRKTEGEQEVSIREIQQALRGWQQRSGMLAPREVAEAIRDLEVQIVRFTYGLASGIVTEEQRKGTEAPGPTAPALAVGTLRDAVMYGTPEEVEAIRQDRATLSVVAKEVGLSEQTLDQILDRVNRWPDFKLAIEDLYYTAKRNVELDALTAIEQIEDALRAGDKPAAKRAAASAIGRLRAMRRKGRREARGIEAELTDLEDRRNALELLKVAAAQAKASLPTDRPYARKMRYKAQNEEVLEAFPGQEQVRIKPSQAYDDALLAKLTTYAERARAAIDGGTVDEVTARGLENAIPSVYALIDANFTTEQIDKTLAPNRGLDFFTRTWLRTPEVLSALVPGVWGREIKRTERQRTEITRKANRIGQKYASKRKQLMLDAAESLDLDIRNEVGTQLVLMKAFRELAHRLRQTGSDVEVGQALWTVELDGRSVTPELLNWVRLERRIGRELQGLGVLVEQTIGGKRIQRKPAETGDVGLARMPDADAVRAAAEAYATGDPEIIQAYWDNPLVNGSGLTFHIMDSLRNDLLEPRILADAERAVARKIISGSASVVAGLDAWVSMLAQELPETGPWGSGRVNRAAWVRSALLEELSAYGKLAQSRVAESTSGPARSVVETRVADNQNEFTQAAAKLAFPGSWYVYGASDSFKDFIGRVTSPADVEYGLAIRNGEAYLEDLIGKINTALGSTAPLVELNRQAKELKWALGGKPVTLDNVRKLVEVLKGRRRALAEQRSRILDPNTGRSPLPVRFIQFLYGPLLATPTAWASQTFGAPITAWSVYRQFMSGPRAMLTTLADLVASPLYGTFWERSPFGPGMQAFAGRSDLHDFLEAEGSGASWNRQDVAEQEAWAQGHMSGGKSRAAINWLRDRSTELSNVFGVGVGDTAANRFFARFVIPRMVRRVRHQTLAGGAKNLPQETREFLGQFGQPEDVAAAFLDVDPKRWWKNPLGAKAGYALLEQLNIAAANNRPDANWLTGLLGWSAHNLALNFLASRQTADAGTGKRARDLLLGVTATALLSALAFWWQQAGRNMTKEAFSELAGELAVALSGAPDDDDGWPVLDWMSDNLARVVGLLRLQYPAAPVAAVARGVSSAFQPSAKVAPWESAFWTREPDDILKDVADAIGGGFGFSVSDPNLPAISLGKSTVKSALQISRGVAEVVKGDTAAGAADVRAGVRSAAGLLGAWGSALSEAVLPGGYVGRESRRILQRAAREAGIQMDPPYIPGDLVPALSFKREILSAGDALARGDAGAEARIQSLTDSAWTRAYERSIARGNDERTAKEDADNAIERLAVSLEPVRDAVGRSLKPEELAKMKLALETPAVKRTRAAADAAIRAMEKHRKFRAPKGARSPLKAARGGRGRLRLSLPRVG